MIFSTNKGDAAPGTEWRPDEHKRRCAMATEKRRLGGFQALLASQAKGREQQIVDRCEEAPWTACIMILTYWQ
jgi:hypothetical protein